MDISEKIKEIRSRKGLSQKLFAETLGYSQGYISDIESKRTKPSRGVLEAIGSKFNVSLDWLISDNKILDLIEINKKRANKDLIFLYGFTQRGLDKGEQMLRDLLGNRQYLFVDATNIKGVKQFLKEMVKKDGEREDLWEELNQMLLREEIIVIIKNISKSKIPRNVDQVRGIFKIMDDAHFSGVIPKSLLILLDFPSYIEKNFEDLGHYVIPIYIGEFSQV